MSEKKPTVDPESPHPFGSDPNRSSLPLYIWIVAYILWFAALVAMAVGRSMGV